MRRNRGYVAFAAALTVMLLFGLFGSAVAAVGEKIAVFGADLTEAERQELAQLFQLDPGARVDTLTTQEYCDC